MIRTNQKCIITVEIIAVGIDGCRQKHRNYNASHSARHNKNVCGNSNQPTGRENAEKKEKNWMDWIDVWQVSRCE